MQPSSLNSQTRAKHPVLPELVGGLDLSRAALAKLEDPSQLETLIEMLTNAEYWLSYEPDAFDPEVLMSPSPIRELGIGIALRFGQSLDGDLAHADIEVCRQHLESELPEALFRGLSRGLDTLTRIIKTRGQIDKLQSDGYGLYERASTLSIHALRASGRGTIKVDGSMVASSVTTIQIGHAIKLAAMDEKARPLSLPEIDSPAGAPIYAREGPKQEYRECIFTVPGLYRVSVPSRAEGGHKLLVS